MDDIFSKLKYISTERLFQGIITEVHEGGVVIDLKGRLGQLKIPLRMLISSDTPRVGQTVGFLMSYPEVIESTP